MTLSAGNVTRMVASYSYDDIGRLVSLKRSGKVGVVNYAYNIRNWLKEMKSDRFSQNLWYETTGAYPCFNGNISRLQWQSGKANSPEESWKNLIKLNNLVGDNIAHYNLPAAQQSAIENYLNIHSFPSYRLFDKEGNLVDVKVDARQLDDLEKIIKELNR